jgi:hypothetical protein
MDSQTNELYINQSLWNNLIRNNINKIEWICIGNSRQPEVIELLTEFYKTHNLGCWVCWEWLSRNPSAIDLLTANQDKIKWKELSSNPAAIELLTANQDKIDWKELSSNPAAIDLLMANQDKINWSEFSKSIGNAFQPKKKDDPNLTLNNRLMELELENSLLQLRLENSELKTEQLRMEFETFRSEFKSNDNANIVYGSNYN